MGKETLTRVKRNAQQNCSDGTFWKGSAFRVRDRRAYRGHAIAGSLDTFVKDDDLSALDRSLWVWTS